MGYQVRNGQRWLAMALLLGACSGGEGGDLPYGKNEATLIGQNRVALSLIGPDCETSECEAVRGTCGNEAAADIVLGESGEVLDVICYEQDREVLLVEDGSEQDFTLGNHTVLELGEDETGAEVSGDVVIEGNGAVLYGHGADISILDGSLHIEKNNAIVRGTRILGDVTITKNNAKLAFCAIEGTLTITGNNTTLAECEVHGAIDIVGMNTVLVQNRIRGVDRVEGFNLRCDQNVHFDDTDESAPMGDAEPGGIECEEADGRPSPQSNP